MPDPITTDPAASTEVPKSGVLSSEFWITVVTTLGLVTAAIILICKDKVEQGIQLLMASAGVGTAYSGMRTFIKR